MRKYRLRIGLDVDDVLYECNSYALQLLREKYGDDPVFDINLIRSWGPQGTIADERIHYFSDPKFVEKQPMFPGAQDFVRELSKIAEVFFVTSVPAECMTARARRLSEDFPEVPKGNLLIGTRKDIVNLDILLDDAAHNISSSQASYPVLMRRPWNTSLSGLLSVNSYSDFLHLARIIGASFVEEAPDLSAGGVLCLVGPSGTGKNEIASELTKDGRFVKPRTTTTKPRNDEETEDHYRFVSSDEFLKEKDTGRFIETTFYSRYYFGTSAEEISPIVDSGRIAVIPIDICGAMTLKNLYRSKCVLVFTDRDKAGILRDLLHRDIPDEDKVSRMLSIDFEMRNLEFCDFSVRFEEGPEACAETIVQTLSLPLRG
ncbi:MAG: hypothetical protein IJM50_02525 [Lachnospiraceae bacterium]|nr:hypothetical protein [Lachnospiraceae bacterium]